MTLENYISLQGPLAETFPKLAPETIQHADQLTNLRRTHPDESKRKELRKQWFYTADGSVYTIESDGCQECGNQKENVVLYLTRGKDNLIFKNIEEATQQLINNKNYTPSKEDLDAVIDSTQGFNLGELGLEEHGNEFSRFRINTKKYKNSLNSEQRELAERIYGQGDDFEQNMKMFRDSGIKETRIYVLNPEYVKKTIKKNKAPALARAGWLSNFASDSSFDASVRIVGDAIRLFGVPRSPQARAENSDTQNGGPYRSLDAGSPNLENTLKTVFEVSQDYIPSVIKATYEAKIREALGKLF